MDSQQVRGAVSNPEFRRQTRRDFLGFDLLYLPHYFQLEPADFHPELIDLLSDSNERFLSIIGFRGSAKSSYGGLALPLWLGLEYPDQFPFIVIVNETTAMAAETIASIRKELETNERILEDYGDVSEGVSKQREWTRTSILLKNGVRILGLSRGQRIRGRRHNQFRPSIVIVDDPEEMGKVEKKEYRDKTERWIRNEVIPASEESRGRLIVLGNLLHTDAIMARLKNDPVFKHRDYSLFKGPDTFENCTWKAKYPSQQAIDERKAQVKAASWLREYCLKLVPPEGQVIKEEWIKYYDEIPMPEYAVDPDTKERIEINNPILTAGVGVDLAISKKQTADYTAMTSGVMALKEEKPHVFVLPTPVNMRLNFQETISNVKSLHSSIGEQFASPMFFIEDVAYQRAAIEMVQAVGIPAVPVRVGTDKRSRLMQLSVFIQNGTVLFPRRGCEDLISQLVGFGVEDHDDLADSLVYLVLGVHSASSMDPLKVLRVI